MTLFLQFKNWNSERLMLFLQKSRIEIVAKLLRRRTAERRTPGPLNR